MLVAAAVLVGCGSDSSSDASAADASSEPLTKAQFVKEANTICEKGVREKEDAVTALLKEHAQDNTPPTKDETAEMVEEVILPSYRKVVEQLGELSPPEEAGGKAETVIEGYETALQKLEAEPAEGVENNPFAAPDEKAGAYGLESCRL